MEQFHFCLESDENVYYKNFILKIIRNSYQRSLYLSVEGEVVQISCRKSTSFTEIKNFVDEHHDWIQRQLKEIKKIQVQKTFLSGEKFLFCGEDKILKRIYDSKKIFFSLKDSYLQLHSPRIHIEFYDLQKSLRKFYKEQGQVILNKKVLLFSQKMKLYPSKVSFRFQKTLFGSCSQEGDIHLNWSLVISPHAVMDYVIVHELAHLKYMNHSKEFWSLVKRYSLDYLKSKRWLKTHVHQFNFLYDPQKKPV